MRRRLTEVLYFCLPNLQLYIRDLRIFFSSGLNCLRVPFRSFSVEGILLRLVVAAPNIVVSLVPVSRISFAASGVLPGSEHTEEDSLSGTDLFSFRSRR